MDVYLKNEKEKDNFHFPVNPFSISVNRSKRYETADIIEFGEVDFSDGGKKIKELSFETLLPKEYDTYCRYINIPKPVEVMKKLEKWMEQQEALRLIITDFKFNDLVTITSIDEEERVGETGDKYISINFRTWRELKIGQVAESNKKSKNIQLINNRPNIIAYDSNKPKFLSGDIVIVTASVLNVRKGPSTKYTILGTVKKGERYKIFKVNGNWADIYWGDHGGWICLNYVTKKGLMDNDIYYI